MSPWLQMLLTGLWGGVLALERRAFLQAMFSRPLVAAIGTGLCVHDVEAGLYIGLIFELFYLGGASLGGAHADHETLPAVMSTACAAVMGRHAGAYSTAAMWALSTLLLAPMGALGGRLETRIDERARKYAGRAQTAVESGDLSRAARQNMRAMWPHFVVFALLSSSGLVLGRILAPVEMQLPLSLLRGLAWAWPALGCVAAAVAVGGSHARSGRGIAAWAALGAAGVSLFLIRGHA